jgi:hypothetical protein
VTWIQQADERRRSDARVAALAAAIHAEPPAAPADLFAPAQPPQRSRAVSIIALGLFVVGAAAALIVVLSGSHDTLAAPQAPVAAQAPLVSAPPLELVALTHAVDANGLVVRGIVRNPSAAADVTHLTAVVLLFDHDGGFVTSGHAAVEAPTLAPGMETPFAVAIAGAGDVGRYRVSFRTDDRVMPHVDRRPQTTAVVEEVQQP